MRLAAAQDPVDDDGLVDLICIHIAIVEFRNYKLANRVYVSSLIFSLQSISIDTSIYSLTMN